LADMFDKLTIDLRLPPQERWRFTTTQAERARELLRIYKRDLGLPPDATGFLLSAAKGLLDGEHWMELESLAAILGVPIDDAILCNCYYDILKVVLASPFGCTAFAVDNPGGILHARNLDWWTEDSTLA